MEREDERKEERKEENLELNMDDMREIAKGAYWLIGGVSLFACAMIFFMSR